RIFAVEQMREQCFDGVLGRRLARTHHAVDGNTRGHLIDGFVGTQGLRNIAAAIQIVDVQRLNFADIGGTNVGQYGFRDFVVGIGDDFARFWVDHAFGKDAAQQEVLGHGNAFDLGRSQIAQVLGVDTLVFFDNDRAGSVGNVEVRHFALPALGYELEHAAFVVDL